MYKNNQNNFPNKREPFDGAYRSELEKHFPRIADKIVLMWGANDFPTFLNALMIDDRGNRGGFPPEVVDEMLFLHAIHDTRAGRQSWALSVDDYRVFR